MYTGALEGKVLRKNILESLVSRDAGNSQISPKLATLWKQIDKNTWHFFLRKNVKFHDGGDFNAETVVFNIKRLYNKKIHNQVRNKYFSSIKVDGKALDSHTLEIKTDRYEPLMLVLLSNMPIVSPNTPMDKWTRNPIGTGPYKLARWDAGSQIVLEYFDGYWGEKTPQVKKAVYVWRSESSVRASMVLVGEADLAPNIAREDANKPDMDFAYLNGETTSLRFGGNWEPPLNDQRVRMALNLAVDRNAIRGSILSKDVKLATQVVPPNIFGYNPDLKPWPYDPQKAKALLDEARKDGVPVDTEILIIGRIAYYPGAEELLEAMATMYRAVGFKIKIRMMEKGAYQKWRDKPYPAGAYLIPNQHGNAAGDATFSVFSKYHSKGKMCVNSDKKLDELIEKAQVATGEERQRLFHEVFYRVEQVVIPSQMLFHMVGYARVGERINFKPTIVTNEEIPLAQITFK